MSYPYPIPPTPRVISPSPTPSEASETGRDTYFAPTTRSATKHQRHKSPEPISEEKDGAGSSSDSSLDHRARTRSRSPALAATGAGRNRKRRMSELTSANSGKTAVTKSKPLTNGHLTQPAQPNGHLSPYSYSGIQSRWREFSRSPSPLGLIPLHRHYRYLIHKHEIPRKALHISIGFLTLSFYTRGIQTTAITPWLLSALIPIAATDYLRHRFQSVNRIYIKCLGALMRETEVDGWNGVIWYLLGAYIALRFFPKDIGVMSVLLLSWCDTAASTFGRLYGRYTIRLRSGKSLAGTLAAFLTGSLTAIMFWGWLAPRIGTFADDPKGAFMFDGVLSLPQQVKTYLGWAPTAATIRGPAALGVMSVWTGFVAAFSEFVDILGWDDNLTIPVLSSLGLWGFMKVFGA
jgi:diacylglycerol kinase (CTP)